MMRCIQNALEGGHITEAEARKLNQRVTGLLRHGLAPPDVKARMIERLAFEAQEAERRALIMEQVRQDRTSDILNHKNARGENDPAEALWMLVERQGGAAKFEDVATLRATILRIVHADLESMLHEWRKRYWRGDTRKARELREPRVRNVLHEVMAAKPSRDGGAFMASTAKTGDPTARAFAESWLKVTEYLRRRFNAAGGHIGQLDYGYMPQNHDASALANAGGDPARAQSYWVDFMMQPGLLDRERMVHQATGLRLDDDELRAALEEVWLRIVTNGAIDDQPSYAPLGKGPLATQTRYTGERFLHFKDADAWMTYHREFGRGDAFDAMMAHVKRLSRDIATLEIFGPNPEAMRNYLKRIVRNQASIVRPAATVIGEQTKRLQDLLNSAAGRDGNPSVVVSETRKILEELSELQRRIAAGGSRQINVEHQMRARTDRLAKLKDDLGNMAAGPLGRREETLIRKLKETDGKLAELENAPNKGRRGQRRRQGRLRELRGEAEKLREALAEVRREDVTYADRRAALERQLETAEAELSARLDRNSAGRQTPRTKELTAEVQRIKAEIDGLRVRSSLAWVRPEVYNEMVAAIDRMKQDMDNLASSGHRDLEPVEAMLDALVQRLHRMDVGGLDELIAQSGKIRRIETGMGRSRLELSGQPFDLPLAFFRRLRDEFRQRRLAGDPELQADMEARLTAAGKEYGEILDAIGIGMDDLAQAITAVRQARPLFVAPKGFRSVKNPQDAAERGIGAHDRLWDVMRGNTEATEWKTLANVGRTTRNIMVYSLLGSAMVPAIGDVVLQRQVWRMIGVPKSTLQIMAGTFRAMHVTTRREAVRSMLQMDSALHMMQAQARFSEEFETHSYSGYFADRVINVQGLASWTQAAKHYFGMEFQGQMADRAGLRWSELHPDLRETFNRHSLDAAEWDVMRQAALHDAGGAHYLRPNEIMKVQGGEKIAERYIAMITRLTAQAVIEGSMNSRAFFNVGHAGTFYGEVLRSVGHFKTFPVQVMNLVIGEIIRDFEGGRWGRGGQRLASLLVATTLVGVVINELLEIINGRKPRLPTYLAKGEVPGFEYWMRGMLKGGGLGIYGDMAFSGIDRVGGFSSLMGGPTIGFIDRVRARTADEIGAEEGKSKLGRRAVQTLKEVTPGANLWFSRAITDRLVFAQLQHMFDPDAPAFFRRKEQMQKRKQGNDYWWGPGDAAPKDAPWNFEGSKGGRIAPQGPNRWAPRHEGHQTPWVDATKAGGDGDGDPRQADRAALLGMLGQMMGSEQAAQAQMRQFGERGFLR